MYGDLLTNSNGKPTTGSSQVSQQASTSSNPADDAFETKQCIVRETAKKTTVVSNKMRHIEYKIARTVIFVVTVFSISWTPYAVVTMIGKFIEVI